jgi:hypothetical protein
MQTIRAVQRIPNPSVLGGPHLKSVGGRGHIVDTIKVSKRHTPRNPQSPGANLGDWSRRGTVRRFLATSEVLEETEQGSFNEAAWRGNWSEAVPRNQTRLPCATRTPLEKTMEVDILTLRKRGHFYFALTAHR